MVQQSGELQFPVLSCCFAHTLQPAWPAFPARCPAQIRLLRVLLGLWPSLHNLRRRSIAFVRLLRRYYAAVRLPIAVHEGLAAHRVLPPALPIAGWATTGPPGSRAWSFSACLGSQTPRGHCALALAYAAVLPSGFLNPWAPRNKDFEAQCTAYRYPCPTLQVQLCNCTRMARGQSGSLDPLCTTLPFATPSRFIPALTRNSFQVVFRLRSGVQCLPLQDLSDGTDAVPRGWKAHPGYSRSPNRGFPEPSGPPMFRFLLAFVVDRTGVDRW